MSYSQETLRTELFRLLRLTILSAGLYLGTKTIAEAIESHGWRARAVAEIQIRAFQSGQLQKLQREPTQR